MQYINYYKEIVFSTIESRTVWEFVRVFLTNENILFEVAKCRRTNYVTGNGKHFPANGQVFGPFYPEASSNREPLQFIHR